MPDERGRALKCESLAMRFDWLAEKDDFRAAEFRGWAAQRWREAEEHPAEADLKARAEDLMGEVAYWEKRANWSRAMAGKFRRRAEEHQSRFLAGRSSPLNSA